MVHSTIHNNHLMYIILVILPMPNTAAIRALRLGQQELCDWQDGWDQNPHLSVMCMVPTPNS